MKNEAGNIDSKVIRLLQYQRSGAISKNTRINTFHSNNLSIDSTGSLENEEILQDIVVQLNSITQSLTQISSGKESDDTMEKLTERISNLERDVAVLKERTKKLDDLPTKAEIKTLFTDSINNSNIATRDHVDSKVEQATSSIIKWTIATTLTVGGLVIAIIKLF
ncbi:hypothetical protein ACQYAC_19380 [Bacillus sp. MM09(2025)]|uniref:hypothetical protein n=1 Tax=Bacillus sp. MM09(2025) TaxID=3422493 RepID=UPI003D2E8294